MTSNEIGHYTEFKLPENLDIPTQLKETIQAACDRKYLDLYDTGIKEICSAKTLILICDSIALSTLLNAFLHDKDTVVNASSAAGQTWRTISTCAAGSFSAAKICGGKPCLHRQNPLQVG
jgi:hypothetical protein